MKVCADQEVTSRPQGGTGEPQAGHAAGTFASGQSRLHVCHGTGKSYFGRTASYNGASETMVGGRMETDLPLTSWMVRHYCCPLQVPCAVRR